MPKASKVIGSVVAAGSCFVCGYGIYKGVKGKSNYLTIPDGEEYKKYPKYKPSDLNSLSNDKMPIILGDLSRFEETPTLLTKTLEDQKNKNHPLGRKLCEILLNEHKKNFDSSKSKKWLERQRASTFAGAEASSYSDLISIVCNDYDNELKDTRKAILFYGVTCNLVLNERDVDNEDPYNNFKQEFKSFCFQVFNKEYPTHPRYKEL